ncbi:hypothetical protein [Schleiferilactobacillus shenzhenensis]|uniref:DUF3221 domain-containing protein n=1 Tax=Schleiferilactobacillus shenzhenensis LY-73 TaxID=1231336 RepID=U4TML5_9LACO|nr:hypothetical protein [Schleiferilactobacillus shenzhenensis]ERL64670.1 hypothetical protein L248_0727 [Schleiferilactobacillus shenzhenensis LY-73]
MKKRMLGFVGVVLLGLLFVLGGCQSKPKADLSEDQLWTMEDAPGEHKSPVGKTVAVTVKKIEPDTDEGYDIIAGKGLHFVSTEKNHITPKVGDEIVVKILNVSVYNNNDDDGNYNYRFHYKPVYPAK